MKRHLCVIALVIAAVCRPSSAYIQKVYAFADVLKESTHVLEGRVEKIDRKARTATATITRGLKGKNGYKRVQMNIGMGPGHQAAYMMERIKSGQPIVFFYKQSGNSIACLAHAGGTWFQLFAGDNRRARNKVWWRMSHIEIYFGRTFNGSTPDLIKLTRGVISGKIKSPKPNPKIPKLDVQPKKTPPKPVVGKGAFGRRVRVPCKGGGEIRGISWADVNGDEAMDLLVCRGGGNVLLLGQGGSFVDATRKWGLSGGSRAASWADYDGDDHPDLMTSNFEIFANAGAKLQKRPLLKRPKGFNPEGAGWIDYDGDGRADLLITNGQHGIRLYRNTGKAKGRFKDVSDAVGLGVKGAGVGNGNFMTCFDYDGDGYTDVFYNVGPGLLLHNEGDGKFAVEKSSGLKLIDGNYKRGVTVADYDNDDDLDVLVPGPRGVQLFRNDSGRFVDVAAKSGDLTKVKDPSFSAAFGDADGDGNLDLFVGHTRGRGRLYLGDGKGRFKDVSKGAGILDLAPAWGASFADISGDGYADLVVHQPRAIIAATNGMGRSKGRSPLTIRPAVRRGLVGAVVRAMDASGKLLGMRRLCLPDGAGGQMPPVALISVPNGECKITVCLSDGRVAEKKIAAKGKHVVIRLSDGEFK